MPKRKRTSSGRGVDSATSPPKLSKTRGAKKGSNSGGSSHDHIDGDESINKLSDDVKSPSKINTTSMMGLSVCMMGTSSENIYQEQEQEHDSKMDNVTNITANGNDSNSITSSRSNDSNSNINQSTSSCGTVGVKMAKTIHIKDHASIIMPIVSAEDKWECKYVLSHVRAGNSGYCLAWLDTGFCPQTLINIGKQCSFIHKHPPRWDATKIQEHKKLQKMVKYIFNIESNMETKLVNCQLCESETNDLKQFYCSYLMDNRKLYSRPFTTLEGGGENVRVSMNSSTRSMSSGGQSDDNEDIANSNRSSSSFVNSTVGGFLGSGNDTSSCNFVSSDDGLSDFSDFDDLSTNDSVFSGSL